MKLFSQMQLKSLDANRYATKKTIAQGMLDIALLTANASQLKYILQVGERHEFYTLMLTLICISIVMQVSRTGLATNSFQWRTHTHTFASVNISEIS